MADPNNKNGAQYVVENAMYTCQYGVVPVPLQINQKETVLVQQKHIATAKETMFTPSTQPFGVCSMNPNKQAGQPCTYAKGQWNPTTVYQSNNGTQILTEDSEMICTMFSGKITNIFPGQIASVSPQQLSVFEMEFAPVLLWSIALGEENWFVTNNNLPEFKVTKIKCEGSVSNGKLTLDKRRASELLFEAQDLKEGQKKLVSWIVGEKIDGTEKKGSKTQDQYKCIPYEFFGPNLPIKIDRVGEYFVGAVGYNSSPTSTYATKIKQKKGFFLTDKPSGWNGGFFVNVSENAIKSISVSGGNSLNGESMVRQGDEVSVTLNLRFDFDPKLERINWIVTRNDTEIVSNDKYRTESNGLVLKIKPINAEDRYSLKAQLIKLNGSGKDTETISEESVVLHSFRDVYIQCSLMNDFDEETDLFQPKESRKKYFSMMRPGNTLQFKLTSFDKKRNSDFGKVDWKIQDSKGNVYYQRENADCIYFFFVDPGEYFISADLKDTSLRNGGVVFIDDDGNQISNASGALDKNITHSIVVQNNSVTSIQFGYTHRRLHFPELEYPINLSYKYGKDTTAFEKGHVSLSCDSDLVRITNKGNGNYSFMVSQPGTYTFSAQMDVFDWNDVDTSDSDQSSKASKKTLQPQKVTETITVIDSKVKDWMFCDCGGTRRIKEVAKGMKFGIKASVPIWGALPGQDEPRSVLVSIFLVDNNGWQRVDNQSVDLKDNGNFSKLDYDVDSILKSVGELKRDVQMSFVVYNAPSGYVNGLSERNDKGVYVGSCMLKLINTFHCEGRFINSDGSTLMDVKHYGDSVQVRLRVLNKGTKVFCLRVFENLIEEDKMVFETKDIEFNEDGFATVDIPTDKDGIKHDDHKEATKPRLFFFKLVNIENPDKEEIVFTYPANPLDETLNGVDADKKDEYGKQKDDVNSHPYNFFRQLKLMPKQEENNDYCNTIASMVPVMVGDDDKKTEEEQNDKCTCPNCHEEAEDLEKRLRKAFPKAPAGNAKIVAETYTKYMRRLHMDTCWVKAYFFANISIESGMKLTPRSESGIYSRKTLEETKPSKIFEGNWVGGKYESKKDTSGKKETSSDGRVYQPGLKKKLDDMYDKKGDEKEKAIYNFMYDGENGNDQDGDGYKYRGGAFVQITGRTNYQMVQRMLNVFYDKDVDIMANGCDSFPDNIELATVASMCYLFMKYGDHYRLCNGQKDGMSQYCEKVMGHNLSGLLLCNTCMNSANDLCDMKKNNNIQCKKIKVKGDGCKTTNYGAKQTMLNEFSTIFELDDCKWESRGLSGIWVDPLKNLMACYYSQNGYLNPQNSIFTKKRNNKGHTPHQGVDLFAEECTMTYACMDGKVKVMNRKWGADHEDGLQYIVLEVAKESLPVFRERRRDYTPIHTDPVAYSEVDDDPTFKPDSESIYIIYMHLYGAFVSNEQTVHAGQPIGLTGKSGVKFGTCDPHLHFEIKSKDTYRDGLKNRCNPAHYVYYKQFRNGKGENKGKIELFDSDMQMTTIEATNLDSNEDLKIQKERMEKGKTPAMKKL